MSELKERISTETKTAMKARDSARLAVLRLVNSEIKRVEVDERRVLGDQDIVNVLEKMLKQRVDSESQYRNAGRNDLADQEAFEIKLVKEFMPTPFSEAEVKAAIEVAIQESGASSVREMGAVMNLLKSRLAGRADMRAVSGLVKARLG